MLERKTAMRRERGVKVMQWVQWTVMMKEETLTAVKRGGRRTVMMKEKTLMRRGWMTAMSI
jgi:hypothetical protein